MSIVIWTQCTNFTTFSKLYNRGLPSTFYPTNRCLGEGFESFLHPSFLVMSNGQETYTNKSSRRTFRKDIE